MRGPLLCVGGPLAGQRREVPPGGRSLIVAQEPEMWAIDANMESCMKGPESIAAVTIKHAVYKVEPLGYGFPGGDLRIQVLAYYGTDRKDRPAGFYL